ncbi:hypothetical protein UR09_03010 [Candidatus Nitromaritima sp. SCGC AAA799-A02]|nr:hypothetical protein UR09_03010 [Candidatus Nitromaritima sp. SCGC AAA799-A02]
MSLDWYFYRIITDGLFFNIIFYITVGTAFLPLIFDYLSRKPDIQNNKIFSKILTILPLLWVLLVGSLVGFSFIDSSGISMEDSIYWRDVCSSASILALAAALFPTKYHWSVAGIFGLALPALIFSDLIYYRYFDNVIPLYALSSAGQLWDVSDAITHQIRAEDISFLFLATGSLDLILLGRSLRNRSRTDTIYGPYRIWILRLVLSISGIYTILNVSQWVKTEHSWKIFDPITILRSVGPINAHIRDMAITIREPFQLARISESDINEIKQYLSEQGSRKTPSRVPYAGAATGSNVIFLQIEALQKWVIGSRLNNSEVTPFLNELAKQSFYFSEIFDQTGDSPTANSEFAVLNSNLPLPRGSVAFRRPQNNFVTLPYVLKGQGYSTHAAHAYTRAMWNRGVVFPRYGFEHLSFSEELSKVPKIGWGLADDTFLSLQAGALEKMPQPFFALLITLSSHTPYDYIPDDLRQLNTGALTGTELGNYLHSVHYVDQAIKNFFNKLEKKNLLHNTLLVIYGDHDAKLHIQNDTLRKAFGLLSIGQNELEQIADHRFRVDQIPLIIKLPGKHSPLEIKIPGGLVDIAPTVLNYLGLTPPKSFIGQTLFPDQKGFVTNLKGHATNSNYLYDPGLKESSCIRWNDAKPVPNKRCNELRTKARTTLDISWKITLHNLARSISEREMSN